MDILAIIYRIKEFFITGMHNFPLIIGLTSLILVCATSNMGYTVLLLSLATLVPLLTFGLNLLAPFIQMALKAIAGLFNKDIDFSSGATAVCNITREGSPSLFPSYWMAAVVFIFTFVAYNGGALYNYVGSSVASDEKISARKAHALIGIISSAILGLVFIVWRLTTGCEQWLGVVMSLLFIGVAIGIFEIFKVCGLLRLVDLYGIGSRLLPVGATANPTQVCFPAA